ncbi:MAG TPA: hypothetical protein VLI07_18775 [Candidatus Binatus sp.]|nr:hypothetical protein [Candidatus Binatus sp.]
MSMPVKTGFDYHLAEVQRTKRAGDEKTVWFAACEACGWAGRHCDTKDAAEVDALAHDTYSNPPSNR